MIVLANTYTLISSNVLSATTTTVTFSSIPQTYTDLVLQVSSRASSASGQQVLSIYINGDSTSRYGSTTQLRGNGSAASSVADASQGKLNIAITDADTATASTFGSAEIYIPSYTLSTVKSISGFSVQETNAAAAAIRAEAGLWNNAAAVTSISLYVGGDNFLAGSSFYLYGIKNS